MRKNPSCAEIMRKNNKKNGLGLEYWENENIAFKGYFKDGIKDGHGASFKKDGSKEYDGEWKLNNKNGKGTIYFNNEISYVGDMKNNERDGKGVFYFDNQNTFTYWEGEFKNDSINGNGILYIDGEKKFEGKFDYGKPII